MIPEPPKTAPPRSSLIPSRRRRRPGQTQTPPLTTTTPPTPTKPKTVLEIGQDRLAKLQVELLQGIYLGLIF